MQRLAGKSHVLTSSFSGLASSIMASQSVCPPCLLLSKESRHSAFSVGIVPRNLVEFIVCLVCLSKASSRIF